MMQDRPTQLVTSPHVPLRTEANSSRLVPLAIAGASCFLIAVITGTLAWYLFWLPYQASVVNRVTEESPQNNAVSEVQEPQPIQDSPKSVLPPEPVGGVVELPAVDGTVDVPGGETVLSGNTNRPIERVIVDQFSIADTEVTNAEYSEFIRETGHAPPPGWNGYKFPADTSAFPVVNVSWRDAVDFCKWKESKLGLVVRLPTEAEWELAARGPQQLKYPWGNDWNNEAASTKESGGKVSAVKSFAINRTGLGVYDMIGNVWEWVADEVDESETVSDTDVEAARKQGQRLRIVKGGSAEESLKDVSSQSRYEVPENTKVKVIGFRYVVIRKNPSQT